jgi:acid phosphatase family membrane protein YuiD
MENWLSVYIAAPILAWLVAQFVKLLLAIRSDSHTKDLSVFFKSGNMPSSHTATMFALLTTVGYTEGVTSPLFGVVVVMTAVVIYDAVNVRRAVGEQGEVLKKLTKSAKVDQKFYMAKGHKPLEVVAGALVGVLSAVVILYFFEIF